MDFDMIYKILIFFISVYLYDGYIIETDQKNVSWYLNEVGIDETRRYSVYWKEISVVDVSSRKNFLDLEVENEDRIVRDNLEDILELRVDVKSKCNSMKYSIIQTEDAETKYKKTKLIHDLRKKYERASFMALDDGNCMIAEKIQSQMTEHIMKILKSKTYAYFEASTKSNWFFTSTCHVRLLAKVVNLSLECC